MLSGTALEGAGAVDVDPPAERRDLDRLAGKLGAAGCFQLRDAPAVAARMAVMASDPCNRETVGMSAPVRRCALGASPLVSLQALQPALCYGPCETWLIFGTTAYEFMDRS